MGRTEWVCQISRVWMKERFNKRGKHNKTLNFCVPFFHFESFMFKRLSLGNQRKNMKVEPRVFFFMFFSLLHLNEIPMNKTHNDSPVYTNPII